MHTKDCLHGGQSWKTLLKKGNGMSEKFRTPNAILPDGTYDIGAQSVQALFSEVGGWDFAVLNTYSQEAAGVSSRANGVEALKTIAPMMAAAQARPVLMSTPAYRTHTKGSEKLGDWQEFTWLQSDGFRVYKETLVQLCPFDRQPKVADVNRAFEIVHGEYPELWEDLFHTDDFHPSSLGSFLVACVLFCAVFEREPSLASALLEDPALLFERARRMLPPPYVGRMPTGDELLYLRGVAVRTFNCAELAGAESRQEPIVQRC